MAKANVNEKETLRSEAVAQTVSKTEQFFNENKKTLWGLVAAVVVLGLCALGYSKLIYQPKCNEAMQQAYQAEMQFEKGEYELALKGDGNIAGFEQVIADYGAKAGKSIYLDAGICALHLGNYEDAVNYISSYKGKEPILAARAKALLGDAYVGLENYDAAVKAYNAAAAAADNVFAAGYLLKAGSVYEKLGDKAAAKKCYTTVKESYPQSVEAFDIDKYIARVEE